VPITILGGHQLLTVTCNIRKQFLSRWPSTSVHKLISFNSLEDPGAPFLSFFVSTFDLIRTCLLWFLEVGSPICQSHVEITEFLYHPQTLSFQLTSDQDGIGEVSTQASQARCTPFFCTQPHLVHIWGWANSYLWHVFLITTGSGLKVNTTLPLLFTHWRSRTHLWAQRLRR
jgi:hypothetical protein